MALNFKRSIELRVPAERLWPLIADTDRVNRAVGLPPVVYAPSAEGSLLRLARAKAYGLLPMSWDEPPFEWVENQFYSVRRAFHGSPLREVHAGVRVYPQGDSTRVEVFADVEPRHRLGALMARAAIGGKSMGDFAVLCRSIERSLTGAAEEPFARPSGRGEVRAEALERIFRDLREKTPADPVALKRLERHLAEAYDEDVVRMRPFELADRWGLDRLKALRAFLFAARFGALDVSWDVLCPNCRVVKSETHTLAEFRKRAHCDTCGVGFDAGFDSNVEVRFTANPNVRKAADAVFCIGGPRNTPHRLAQLRLGPGESRAARLELKGRRYILRSLTGKNRLRLVPDPGGGASSLSAAFDADAPEGELRFKPGTVELALERRGGPGGELWAALEEEAWTEQAATAAFVTTLQDFRDLFSSEVLSPGEEVAIKSVALLFTDIKGSTALYERVGDAPAYALVREHFQILVEAVRDHRGGIVKTIGDAIMAAFLEGPDAAAAAMDIQRRFAEYNRSRPAGRAEIVVKAGVHMGPAIVVNAKGLLDYFGTTVNVASRIQSESVGGDVVLSRPMFECSQEALKRDGCRSEPFEISLKGLSGSFRLWRVWPGAASAP